MRSLIHFTSDDNMLLFKLLIGVLVSIVTSEPGAPWTEDEALIVKAKLYAIIGLGANKIIQEYFKLHPELGLTTWDEKKTNPSAAKMLR